MTKEPASTKPGFMARLEARFRPPSVILEDPAMLTRLTLINGAGLIGNSVFLSTLLFVNGETAVAWTVVALGVTYILALLAFVITGSASVYIHGVVWPSLVQSVAAHVMLGGFIWSGATLFWGIINCVVAAMFLGRRPGAIIAGGYVLAAIVLAFLEPNLQAARTQPALVVSVALAVNVFVISVITITPIVLSLMGQVNQERGRSESLLRNVLPEIIVDRLKRDPGVIADAHEGCTVMFADIVGFTDHTTQIGPEQLIIELNLIFSRFDSLVAEMGAEKIKTMGDGYLAVAGAPSRRDDHAEVMCELALRLQETMPELNEELDSSLQLRVGLHSGPLVAGVVGASRFSYDLWGETVNLASRMEELCPPGGIKATDAVAQVARPDYVFEHHDTTEVKGVGPVPSSLLVRRARPRPSAQASR